MPDNAYVSDVEAEKAVLAACLVSEDAAKEIVNSVKPEDFFRVAHAIVFDAMRSIVSDGKPLDYVVLAHRLEARGVPESTVSRLDLLNLCDQTFSIIAWREHVRIVRECSAQRRILNAALYVVAESSRAQEDFGEYLAASKAKLMAAFPPDEAFAPTDI